LEISHRTGCSSQRRQAASKNFSLNLLCVSTRVVRFAVCGHAGRWPVNNQQMNEKKPIDPAMRLEDALVEPLRYRYRSKWISAALSERFKLYAKCCPAMWPRGRTRRLVPAHSNGL